MSRQVEVDPCPKCGAEVEKIEAHYPGGPFVTFEGAAELPARPAYRAMPCGHAVAATVTGDRVELVDVLRVDAIAQLGFIEAQCAIAREALADEHEGNFTRAVEQIAADAELLAELVASSPGRATRDA